MNDDIKWKIDAEIEKDKRVSELKWQNKELKQANDYLQEKLHEVKEPINHYHSECVELRRICNQLQSNWNSLRECIIGVIEGAREELNTIIHTTDISTEDGLEYVNQCSREFDVIRKNLEIALDKMNELEGNDKE